MEGAHFLNRQGEAMSPQAGYPNTVVDTADAVISDAVFVAHVRQTDGAVQTLGTHLLDVSMLTSQFAAKIGVKEVGALIGLLHDFGKYSQQFQNYIQSATGLLDPDLDSDNFVDADANKGKIDHSSAGAQWIWQKLHRVGKKGEGALCAQIMALCIASHHSGLIDCLKPEGEDAFARRMSKQEDKTHLQECERNADDAILAQAQGLLGGVVLVKDMLQQLAVVMQLEQHGHKLSETIIHFYLGLWTRFLFSCLIDADRIDSADFERPYHKSYRHRPAVDWTIAIDRMERFLAVLPIRDPIDAIRRDISQQCRDKASGKQGVYSLTVPTGGGKTYASLRFALHHAQQHGLDRVIYIVPFTTIIEQNADDIRQVIEHPDDRWPWVLEHHSNLEPEQQTWHSKLVAENWDAPIVLTTMVQFLEALFSGGTRSVRRLHQLANSIIIFDEIQTLPIRCVHLFCNAINFLATHAKTTAVMCTATQPLLNKLSKPEKGQLFIPAGNELVTDVELLFRQLERVKICNKTKIEGWSVEEIAEFTQQQITAKGSCLVIVNTKVWAQRLYQQCASNMDAQSIFHLSTSQCPAHRKKILDTIRQRLQASLPVLCISTQLIEAGVNIDFASVIRFLAGLDSIAQAAGRCNRHGKREISEVYVINPVQETIDTLIDIKIGQEKMRRILDEDKEDDLLKPAVMSKYFDYYFYSRAEEMDYPLSVQQVGRQDNLLNLLANNPKNIGRNNNAFLKMRQSFMTAGEVFKAIDAPTKSVIVPYGEGKQLIVDLGGQEAEFNIGHYYQLLKKAQKYSVNVFPNVWGKLVGAQAVFEVKNGEGVYALDSQYYSEQFGLATEVVAAAEFLSF